MSEVVRGSGQVRPRRSLALFASLLAVLLTTTLAFTASTASAQTGTCTTDVHDDAETAKSKFKDDCGQPFENTSDYRCDWVPGGWVCTGPGQVGRTSAASAQATVATPYVTEAKDNGSYVGVKWAFDSGYTKVEIYRDTRNGRGLQYLATVDSGNVLNDYSGQPDHIYQVLAHDRAGNLSTRSNFLAATGDNTYDTPTQARNRRRNPFTMGPTLEELDAKSPAKAQNQEMLRRYKEMLQQQKDDWQYIEDLKAAEEWDRQQAAIRAENERAAQAQRNEQARREREAQRDRDSDRDQAERNDAGHANPGSDAGTDELSGYAG